MNFTKKEIQELSTLELALRFNYLVFVGETMDAVKIPAHYGREVVWIEDELHKRLIKAVGHDFYPPEPKATQPSKSKIKFKIAVFSSMGSKAAEFAVEAISKPEAEHLARKRIRRLGLIGSTFRVS